MRKSPFAKKGTRKKKQEKGRLKIFMYGSGGDA